MCGKENCQHSDQPEIEAIAPLDGGDVQTKRRIFGRFGGLLVALANKSQHLARFAEVSAACSCAGACPTCIGVSAGAILLPMLPGRGDNQDPESPQKQ